MPFGTRVLLVGVCWYSIDIVEANKMPYHFGTKKIFLESNTFAPKA